MGRLSKVRRPMADRYHVPLLGTARATAENDSVDAAMVDAEAHIGTLIR